MRIGVQRDVGLSNSPHEHPDIKGPALPGGRDPAAERWRGLGQRPISVSVFTSFECNTATRLALTPQTRQGVRGAKLPGEKLKLRMTNGFTAENQPHTLSGFTQSKNQFDLAHVFVELHGNGVSVHPTVRQIVDGDGQRIVIDCLLRCWGRC